ncbi:MAG: DUF3857 domain-containing protein [Bacteroidales bacterium]|nr:DUF3857 domain-containing protein [Bacteroidales bacterium]
MSNKFFRKVTLFFILLGCFKIGIAQKDPMKFGKIDIEDLKMTTYEQDTSAIALVLCDFGEFNPSDFKFTRHCRIKILKKEGVDKANIYVRSRENIMLKARTYNLVNGEIEETKMKKESVFEERIENFKAGTRFTLPNVKVGSVIEFQYTFSGIPYEWRFQREIPVKWSELRMFQSPYVIIQKNFFGFEPLSVVEDNRWIAKDMPAFRREPYMNSSSNYLTQFEFDIREIAIPGKLYEEFTTSWDEVSETLEDDRFFGEKLKMNLFLNSKAKIINESNLTEIEKAKYAYEMVRKDMVWNEIKRIYAYKDLRFVYDKRAGSVAEINLILVALLNKIGIKTNPVVLSTRDNGFISPIFPSINKLNYVIAAVEIDEKTYLLDATDRLVPFGMLPKRCINGEGRTVTKDNSKWLKLDPSVKAKEVIYSEMTLSSLGEISGNITYKMYDYAAYDFRKKMEEYISTDDYVKFRESNYAGMSIEEYEFKDIDSIYKPVSATYMVNFQNDAYIIADKIYLNPLFFEKVDDNPFKLEKREYPVDFIHPIEKTYIVSLNIPAGYIVEELPKPAKVTFPNKAGSFLCSANTVGKKIQYTYKYNINKPIILSTEYKYLKQFYELLVAKHSEMIVLKKNNI